MYLQRRLNEKDWAQLEEAARCGKVVKMMVNVGHSARASRTLAAGFRKNTLLTEVKLGEVPKKLVESMREILCTNSALTVKVSDIMVEDLHQELPYLETLPGEQAINSLLSRECIYILCMC